MDENLESHLCRAMNGHCEIEEGDAGEEVPFVGLDAECGVGRGEEGA